MPTDPKKPPAARTTRTPKTRTKPPSKPRRDWKPAWLEAFKEHGTVTAACESAKIGRSAVYAGRSDKEFAEAWDAIEDETSDAMEREAYRRGVEGVSEPMVSAGKHVTDCKKYSDTLLIFMLKSRRPERFRENVKVEHAGTVKHGQALDLSKLSDRELAQLEQLTAKAA